jgi:hypothetical protein
VGIVTVSRHARHWQSTLSRFEQSQVWQAVEHVAERLLADEVLSQGDIIGDNLSFFSTNRLAESGSAADYHSDTTRQVRKNSDPGWSW